METIKTTVVVASLLGVLYGVYTILNQQPADSQTNVAAAFEEGFDLDIDFDGGEFAEPTMDGAPAGTEFQAPALDGYPSPEGSMGAAQGFAPPQVTNTEAPTLSADATDLAPFAPPPSDTEMPEAGAALANPGLTNPPLGDSAPENEPVPPMPMATPLTPEGDVAATPDVEPAPSFNPNDDPISNPPGLSDPPALSGGPEAGVPAGPAAPQLAPPPTEGDSTANAPVASAQLSPFQRARRTAKAQIDSGQHKDALFTLSLFFGDPSLSEQERTELLDMLDPLAGRVIYSREHLLTSAHVTTQGETIEEIAAKYQVPAQLLINVNGIQRPDAMTSGMQLKVVPGPFRAEIDTQRNEMTLFLRRMYAGRFPISIGNDPTPRPGEYTVKEKTEGQTFYGAGGQAIPAGAANNPYGSHWLNLGGITIHGTPQQPTDASRGCVSLSPRDASDVYNILSVGSKAVVK